LSDFASSGIGDEEEPLAQQLPIGIYEKALPSGVTWSERLDLARSAGFDFVEMSVDENDARLARLHWTAAERAALRNAIADSGVGMITMCLSGHRKWALGSADPAIRGRGLEMLRRAVDLCVDTGIRIIQIAGYYVYYEPHTPDSRPRYVDGLAQGLAWASQAGVMLGVENVDGHDIDSVTQAMTLVEAFNSPWFQIYPDIGNLSEHGMDVCAELRAGRGHFVALHVKDTRPGQVRRIPFGQGTVPFDLAFRQLVEMNFCAPVLLEMWNDDAPDSVQIVRDARRWVVEHMATAGLIAPVAA
jgi:L-ribulose-5-phosphate 3-epimerase